MKYLTRHLSKEEKIIVLKQIMGGGIKGSVHDTIRLPPPLRGNDLDFLPQRATPQLKLKWPITPFRELQSSLVKKGYTDLDFHTRISPFPVDPGTVERDYLIGPAQPYFPFSDESSTSSMSDFEQICLRKMSHEMKTAGDHIPEGYTEAPASKEKVWDVLFIPEIAPSANQRDEAPKPVLMKDVNREGMLEIYKTSEAFYILDKVSLKQLNKAPFFLSI